jgi:hypothetical protein
MKIANTFALVAVSLASLSQAYYPQANYYSDTKCKDWLVTPPNAPTDSSCYTYEWAGVRSANVPTCEPTGENTACGCAFFSDAHCKDQIGQATNWGSITCSTWPSALGSVGSYSCQATQG